MINFFRLFSFYLVVILSFSSLLIFGKDTTDHKLNQHGVPSSMRRAIQGMTASGLQKDAIIKNLKGHYPEKETRDLSDIIVLANADGGQKQPRKKDNQKEMKRKIKNAEVKFNQWKNRLG
jgi:hypothetical protein